MNKIITYFNQWGKADDEELQTKLAPLSSEEVAQLNPGDTVWVHDDSIDPRGKVYGFEECTISRIKKVDDDTVLYFKTESTVPIEDMIRVGSKPGGLNVFKMVSK